MERGGSLPGAFRRGPHHPWDHDIDQSGCKTFTCGGLFGDALNIEEDDEECNVAGGRASVVPAGVPGGQLASRGTTTASKSSVFASTVLALKPD
jgi:hypothetical protein